MLKQNKIFTLLFIFLMCCSSNDDGNSNTDDINPSNIIGQWNLVLVNGSSNSIFCPKSLDINEVIIGEIDKIEPECINAIRTNYQYSLEGNSFTFITDFENIEYEIITLNNTQLIWETFNNTSNEIIRKEYERIE